MNKFMLRVDEISTYVGKAASWLIILLMLMVCTDVVRRYALNAPSAWIGELSVMAYGTLFMMCGAYTLAQNGHVRGDFLYGSMKPLNSIHYLFLAWHYSFSICRLYLCR